MKQASVLLAIFILLLVNSCSDMKQKVINSDEMMIRISEIGIDSVYLNEYIRILKEESEASVRLEPGVISIYPMFQKENPTEIRILEIYANKKAYESHLQTPHFKTYKSSTLKMVKTLKLVDMEPLDINAMPKIFKKLDQTEKRK